jgi:TFIIF-interacting CTD phosphatase-like protein
MHLVLDLDETLIYVSIAPVKEYDFTFTLQNIRYYVKKRPNLDLFLTFVFQRFQSVSVWTAATADYASEILGHIMTPDQRNRLAFFYTRWDLESPIGQSGPYFKPLKKIFDTTKARQLGMNLHNTIMVDDRNDVLRDNPGNGILIPPWKGNKNDKYLPKLLIVLDGIIHYNLEFGHFLKVIDLRSIVDRATG